MSELDQTDEPGVDNRIVREAIEFWKLSSEAEQDNRNRGLYAAKFALGGKDQWDPEMYDTRTLDARPCESYNQIPNFINQVVNDGRMNMPQTRFIADDDGDVETAERMEDLARNIQQQSDAEISYDNALYGQCTNGWGYWRYITEYENDKSFDQIIKIVPIWNPFTVYDDPFAIQPDKLDRKRLIQVTDMKLKDFNESYNMAYDASDLESIGDQSPAWATSDSLRVAEYWKLTEEKYTLYRNKKTGSITKDKPKDLNNYDTRQVVENKVKWYLVNGKEVMEQKDWPGIYIPYVKVVGQEVVIDGQNIISGLVERMIPAQKQMNYWTNAATEMVALAPKSPFIADPKAIGPYQAVWDTANIRNYAYLPYNSTDEKGQQLQVPQRAQNGADISAMVAMTQQAQQQFYDLSGIYPASLGQASNEKSGKAILARQREGDTATFHIHDNMTRGQRAGGRILADLIPKIYDGSRTVTGKREDGSTYPMPINQAYKDKKTNKKKEHDFTRGFYSVAVTTGPSFSTKRQESNEFYQALTQTVPGVMDVMGDIILQSSDAAGSDKAAERMKRLIEMSKPGLIEEADADPIPPQVKAQLQQAQQLIQQQQVALQQAEQELASKQADYQLKMADLQLKQQDLQSSAQGDQLKAETDRMKLALDQEKLNFEREKLFLEHRQAQVEAVAARMNGGEDMKLSPAVLQTMLAEAEQEQMQQQMLIQQQQEQQALAQQQAMLEQQVAAEQEAQKAMDQQNLMGLLAGIQQSLNMVAASFTAPKQVVRDENGSIVGLATRGNA